MRGRNYILARACTEFPPHSSLSLELLKMVLKVPTAGECKSFYCDRHGLTIQLNRGLLYCTKRPCPKRFTEDKRFQPDSRSDRQ